MKSSFRSFSFQVSLIKFYTVFVFSCMLVRVWLISFYLIQTLISDTVTYSCKFSGSHSGVVEDSSRLECHTGRLRVIVPWRRRNYVLSKHWVPHIQRHNLTSQETWTQIDTSLPIFIDRFLLRLLMICTTLTSSKDEMRIPKKPNCRNMASDTKYTDVKANKKKYSPGTALFSFQEGGQIVSTTDKRCASRRQRHVCDNATAGYKELLIIPTRTHHFATQLSSELVARMQQVARKWITKLKCAVIVEVKWVNGGGEFIRWINVLVTSQIIRLLIV